MHRRSFLKYLATATATITTGSVAMACSNSKNNTSSQTDVTNTGLRIAAIGAPGENLIITEAVSTATWAAIYATYESLVIAGDNGANFQLAKSITSNKDATTWIITLRENARFSDGSEVTADDVFASLKYIVQSPMHGMTYRDVEVEKSQVKNNMVELALSRPRADFIEAVLSTNSLVYKDGDPKNGIGSGPYVVESGDSGQGWKFTANKHFPTEKRVSDALEIQVIADADARLRAVDSNAVDLAMDLPSTAMRRLKNAQAWSPGPADSKGLMFILNTKVAPFDNPEVRRAFKIALDRQALIDTVFDGAGTVGADVPGFGFLDYPSSIKEVERDVTQAHRIFKKYGIRKLTLVTADFTPGMNDSADIAAQQLKEAGVTVTVQKRDPTTYFSDITALRSLPLFASYFVNRPLSAALPFLTGSNAMFNMSGFGETGDWDKRLAESQAETDANNRQKLINKLAQDLQQNGGDVIWGYANEIHGRVEGTPDLPISQSVPVPIKM